MSIYPPADAKTQWFEDNYPGAVMTPNVGLLHTTEGVDWPTYSGGSIAPNCTAKPLIAAKKLAWRQHYPDERSSRALVNAPGGVETNTLNVTQVELVGTCDPAHRVSWGKLKAGVDYIFWPDAPDWLLDELADWIVYMHKTHGVKLEAPTFKAYPASYGTSNGVRFTGKQWSNFYGFCGHQHAPENVHGDPGALDIDKVFAFAKAKLQPPPPPPNPTPAHALDGWFYNLRVGRPQAQVSDEVHAMLATGPSFLGLCEAVGYTLPKVGGYTLIRDRSSQARADVALYVSDHLGVDKSWWKDLKKTWPQVKHNGTHAPRSLLVVKLGNGWRLVVGQVPQKPLSKFDDATNKALIAARAECSAALSSLIAPSALAHPVVAKNPTLAILDWNGISGDVAKNIKGTAADPAHIDNAVGRRVCFTGVGYPRTVGGVELKSDHKHALHFTVTEVK